MVFRSLADLARFLKYATSVQRRCEGAESVDCIVPSYNAPLRPAHPMLSKAGQRRDRRHESVTVLEMTERHAVWRGVESLLTSERRKACIDQQRWGSNLDIRLKLIRFPVRIRAERYHNLEPV